MFESVKSFTSPVINWALVLNPINWVIIPLIVLLMGISLGLVFHPANCDTDSGHK